MTISVDAFVGPSGWSIPLVFRDDSGLTDIMSVSADLGISISVNEGLPIVSTEIEFGSATAPYGPWALVKLPSGLLATDKVSVALTAGSVMTAAGSVPAISGQSAMNLVGGTLLEPMPDPVTMGLAWNIEPDGSANATILYSNLIRRIQLPGSVLTWDDNGYPLKSASQTVLFSLVQTSGDQGGLNKGLKNAPNGLYTCSWPSPDSSELISFGDTTATEVTSQFPQADSVRVFHLQHGASTFSPVVVFKLTASIDNGDGTWTFTPPASVPFVYPPNPVDPSGMKPWGLDEVPPKFYPPTVAMMGSVQALRFMDDNEINNNGIRDRSDFPSPDMLTRSFQQYFLSVPIFSVNGSTAWFDTSQWMVIEITTTAPHGLRDELGVSLSGLGTASLSDGSTLFLDQYIYGGIHVTSPTTFLAAIQGHAGSMIVGTIHPTAGLAKASYGGLMPLEEQLELCRVVGCGIYFNMPATATPECMKAVCDEIANSLDHDQKCWLAWGNELWNFGFINFHYCNLQGFLETGTPGFGNYTWFQVKQSKQTHDIGLASFAAVGRTSDLVRVIETQAGNTGVTVGLCDQVKSQGVSFDALSPAVYFDNVTTKDPTTVDVAIDLIEMRLRYGDFFPNLILAHRTILDANKLNSVGLVNYEGGLDILVTSLVNAFQASHAIARHPRMKNIIEAGLCGGLQRSGVSLFCVFNFSQSLISTGGYAEEWCTFQAFDQRPGTGDPIKDAINITSPEQVDQTFSEAGAGYQNWASLRKGPNPMADYKGLLSTLNSNLATQANDDIALSAAQAAKTQSDSNVNSATVAFSAAVHSAPGSAVVDGTVVPVLLYRSSDGKTFTSEQIASITDPLPTNSERHN